MYQYQFLERVCSICTFEYGYHNCKNNSCPKSKDGEIILGEFSTDKVFEEKKINLCDTCIKHISACDGQPKFGDGLGNDNIIECEQHEKGEL